MQFYSRYVFVLMLCNSFFFCPHAVGLLAERWACLPFVHSHLPHFADEIQNNQNFCIVFDLEHKLSMMLIICSLNILTESYLYRALQRRMDL